MAHTIVVGIEDSFRAEDAVALAGDVARATGAGVLAISAFAFDDRPSEHYNPAMREPLLEAAEQTLDRLCEPLNDLPVRRRAIADPSPARALMRAATDAEAGLIVVGSSHGEFAGRLTPGSTGRRLLQGAPCAVALAPPGHRMRPHLTWARITAAFDGSPGSHSALAVAASLATAGNRRLRVVRVFAPETAPPPWLDSVPGFLRLMPDARARRPRRPRTRRRGAAGRRGRLPDRRPRRRAGARVGGLRPARARIARLRARGRRDAGRGLGRPAAVRRLPRDRASERRHAGALPGMRESTDRLGGLMRIGGRARRS